MPDAQHEAADEQPADRALDPAASEDRRDEQEREAHREVAEGLAGDEQSVRVVLREQRQTFGLTGLQARDHHRELREVVDPDDDRVREPESQGDPAEDPPWLRGVVVDGSDEHDEDRHEQHGWDEPQVVAGDEPGDVGVRGGDACPRRRPAERAAPRGRRDPCDGGRCRQEHGQDGRPEADSVVHRRAEGLPLRTRMNRVPPGGRHVKAPRGL